MVGQKVVFICLVTFAVGVSAVQGGCEVIEEQDITIKRCTSGMGEVAKVNGTCPLEVPMPGEIHYTVEICHIETQYHSMKSDQVVYHATPAKNDGKATCRTNIANCEERTVTKSKKERCSY